MSLFDVSSASDFDDAPSRAHPSVSKAQWASFALGKLRDGFTLVQSESGKVFQFHKPGMPLQPCTPHAARKLLEMGLLTVTKTDIRGTHYALRPAFQPETGPEA